MSKRARATGTRSQSEFAYDILKEMTINFALKPGQRLNEVELSRELRLSRTPLREALNRLAAERLLDHGSTKGFHCRNLDRREIANLYELREIQEVAAIERACERASDEDLAAFERVFHDELRKSDAASAERILAVDEAFHTRLAGLSGNAELVATLASINERIRFIRLIDLRGQIAGSDQEHCELVERLLARDAERAKALMSSHVSKRSEEIVAAIKEGLARIYMPDGDGA